MSIHTVPNTKYVKGVRWLAELYEKKQISDSAAQMLNRVIEDEVKHARTQLLEIEKILNDYEKQFNMSTAEFLKRYQAGKTDDSAESIEWSSLAKMADSLRKRLAVISEEAG